MHHKRVHPILAVVICMVFLAALPAPAAVAEIKPGPVKGTVTMIDLGAKSCIPCRMMAPVLERLEKRYRGRASIQFIDVWKKPEEGRRFGIRVIPTQIFYRKDGKEAFRHEGFLDEASIERALKQLGVQ